jgi:hypothetical protein
MENKRFEIKPTYFLTVFSSREDLQKGWFSGKYVEVLGRLASDKETRNKGLPKNTKYVPPTYEILHTVTLTSDIYGEHKIYEIKCSGSNHVEFNVHGWCTDDSLQLGTKK